MEHLKHTLLTLLRRILLSLFLIFLFLSALVLVDMALGGEEATAGAFVGMLMIASFFAIPYFVLFRKRKTDSKHTADVSEESNPRSSKSSSGTGEKGSRRLQNRKCSNCNSSHLQPYRMGYRCEHCGSIYDLN